MCQGYQPFVQEEKGKKKRKKWREKRKPTISSNQQRKLRLLPPRLQKLKHILRRTGPLQHLPVQLLPLHLLNRNPSLHTHLRAAIVPSPRTARDHIRHARAFLRERRRPRAVGEEHLPELNHLEQADAHDGRLGVVAPAHAGHETGSEGDDVFERAPERDAGDVGDHADVEVWPVEEELEGGLVQGWEVCRLGREADLGSEAFGVSVFGQLGEVELGAFGGGDARGGGLWCRGTGVDRGRIVGDCGLGEFFLGDLVGDVGT